MRTRLPERFGQRCRVVARSRRMNSVQVEFASDGYNAITSGNYLRKAHP